MRFSNSIDLSALKKTVNKLRISKESGQKGIKRVAYVPEVTEYTKNKENELNSEPMSAGMPKAKKVHKSAPKTLTPMDKVRESESVEKKPVIKGIEKMPIEKGVKGGLGTYFLTVSGLLDDPDGYTNDPEVIEQTVNNAQEEQKSIMPFIQAKKIFDARFYGKNYYSTIRTGLREILNGAAELGFIIQEEGIEYERMWESAATIDRAYENYGIDGEEYLPRLSMNHEIPFEYMSQDPAGINPTRKALGRIVIFFENHYQIINGQLGDIHVTAVIGKYRYKDVETEM